MKKQLVVLFLGAAVVLAIAISPASQASRSGAKTHAAKATNARTSANNTYYWISQDSTLPLFVQNDFVGLKKAAQQLHIQYKVAGPTTVNLSQFIATINQVCAQKPAGVIVVGWDPSENSAVNQCLKQGVPTVTDDADLPNSNRLAFVGTNWYDVGVAQANALIQATGGKGEVAVLTIINADNTRLAVSGFKATLAAKAPGLKLVAVEDDGGQEPNAVTDTSNLLAAHPNLSAIAGFDAESGPGIVVALTEAHKLGKVKVSTMEATPAFFNNLKTGAVSAVIVQKRELFTYYALMLLYDYNHDGLAVEGLPVSAATPIPINIDTGIAVVTKASVGQIKTG